MMNDDDGLQSTVLTLQITPVHPGFCRIIYAENLPTYALLLSSLIVLFHDFPPGRQKENIITIPGDQLI